MNSWEVTLERENGINKTVIVDDCMYESEAELLAESQYGLPVLKVIYKGQTDVWNVSNRNDNDYTRYFLPRQRARGGNTVDIDGLFGVMMIIPALATLVIIIEYWLPILLITCGVGAFMSFRK
tara:strand:- start:85 stop:453 length:369 start_codon:yes stop_codon:yes gene_type:complete